MNLPRKRIISINTLYRLITERTGADIKKDIARIAPDLKTSTKDGSIRLIPTAGKIYTDDELKELFGKIGLSFERVIRPANVLDEPESKSSKFPTYAVKDAQGITHYIVQGRGTSGNVGMNFEEKIRTSVESAITSGDINQQNSIPLLKQFKDFLDEPQLVFTDFKHGRVTQRPLQPKPNNAGDAIADFILYDTQKAPYYISLKNTDGNTFSNNGIRGMFKHVGNQIVASNEVFEIDPLLAAVNLDKQKVAKGATEYLTRVPSKPGSNQKQVVTIDDNKKEIIKGYLESAFDYGYYYVREKGKGTNDFFITSLLTSDDLENFIGDITSVEIDYPYFFSANGRQARKGANIYIKTTSKPIKILEHGDVVANKVMEHKFVLQLRNAARGVTPIQINGMFI